MIRRDVERVRATAHLPCVRITRACGRTTVGTAVQDGGPRLVTERLYYTEPALTEFDATVTGVERHGDLPAVLLDRTAFYPTSGGQPHDTGSLNGVRVTEVVERDDDAVLHVVDRAIAVGEAVHGVVDWGRRFDHMQQHTGQHILSAAFDRLWHARTVGFHLGAVVSSLDLDRELPPQAIASAEDEANRIVWEDRPVSIRFVEEAGAAALDLRKEPGRSGVLRIIAVEDYDLSACGGTHVARTGHVGIIVVSSWEKLRGGSRLEFLCGGRALRALPASSRQRCRLHPAPVGGAGGAPGRHRTGAGGKQGSSGRPSGRSRSAWRASRRWRSPHAPNRSRVSAVWSKPSRGGTQAASRRWRCPSHPTPASGWRSSRRRPPVLAVVARSAGLEARRPRRAVGARREVRREGRRQGGPRPGRRVDRGHFRRC